MAPSRYVVIGYLALIAYVFPATADRQMLTSQAALLQGTKTGVDDADRLWLWDQSARVVGILSADGNYLRSGLLPVAVSVDVDTRRGIVALVDDGNALQVITWNGRIEKTIRLPEPASDVAWMLESLVAVTPQFAAHRISVWDTGTSQRTQVIGETLPIGRGPGQHLARATVIRYNSLRDELVALDGTFGRIYRYQGRTGTPLGDDRLPGPPTAIHPWLDSQADDTLETIVVWRYRSFSLDQSGTVWIATAGVPGVALLIYPPGEPPRRVSVEGPRCAGEHSVIWQDMIIFIRQADPHEVCAAVADRTMALAQNTVVAMRLGDTVAPRQRSARIQPNATSYSVVDSRPLPCNCNEDRPTCAPPPNGRLVSTCCYITSDRCIYTCTFEVDE